MRRGSLGGGGNQGDLHVPGADKRGGVHLGGGPFVGQMRHVHAVGRFCAVGLAVLVARIVVVGVVDFVVPGSGVFGLAGGIVGRQGVEDEELGEVFRTNLATGLHQEELLRVAVLVPDDLRAGARDAEKAAKIGNNDLVGSAVRQRRATAGRRQTAADPQSHRVGFRREVQRDRAQVKLASVTTGRQEEKFNRGGRAEHRRTAERGDGDVAFEGGEIDGVGGKNRRGDRTARELVRGVVKRRLGEPDIQGGRAGFQPVVGQVDTRAERGWMDRDVQGLSDGPLTDQLEDEGAIIFPTPNSW